MTYHLKEVESIAFGIPKNKFAGPDDFTSDFIKRVGPSLDIMSERSWKSLQEWHSCYHPSMPSLFH